MRILIVDCKMDLTSWGSPDLVRFARQVPGATIVVRRAPQNDLPSNLEGFDGVIVSGSKTSALLEDPWIESLLRLIRQALEKEIPFLGVCFGHQMLARALGGKTSIRVAQKPEYGWAQIHRTPDAEVCSLFKNLPPSFYSFASHSEEVIPLPAGLKNLAYSPDCAVQACQFKNLPIFGIQFHPEKSL